MFYLIFLGVMGLLNVYVYRRLFKQLHFNLDRIGLVLLSLLFVLQIAFALEIRTHFLPDSPQLYYILSMSVGITTILFFVTIFYDLLHTVSRRIPYDESRRYFIKVIFDVTMLVLAASYLLNGIFGGLRRPVMNDVRVSIKGFGYDNFRIAQLSDIHIGRTIGADFVRECVDRINAQKPDLVVLTGDIVDLPVDMIKEALFELTKLESTYGTYFIMGNHEYFRGPEAVVKHIRELGITVLLNESVIVGEAESAFNLVGINDLVSKRIGTMPYDIEAAFEEVDSALPTIVLAHQPKTVEITLHKEFDLMLSGHTHGGQIFPFGFLVMLNQPYLAGLYDIDAKKQIFVSRGTGYWGPPVRVLAPSEISLLNIHPA
ncbi:MAG: metallophosphoesterase [Sulfurimonadaceae bacterium]|nr:metallophosphoesterase [Sulfurimonadaceae bacterium]